MKTDEAPSTFTLSAVVSPSKQLWSCKPKHWATHPHKSAALTYNCSSVWPCLLRAVPILRRYVVQFFGYAAGFVAVGIVAFNALIRTSAVKKVPSSLVSVDFIMEEWVH